RVTGSNVEFGGMSPEEGNHVGAGVHFQLDNFLVANNDLLSGAQFGNSEAGEIRNNELNDQFLMLDNSYRDIGIYGNQNISWLDVEKRMPPDQVFIKIGTDDDTDINTFTYDGTGITGMAEVRKNSFHCVYYPFWTEAGYPFIEVLENSHN